MKEPTTNELNTIRSKIYTLEDELERYKELLNEYENGDRELESVLDWIDDTEELYRI